MTTPVATERSWLGGWVQPRHTTPEAIERCRATFTGDALHLLTIPGFLVENVADQAAAFLATEADFTPRFAIREDGPAAPGDEHGHDHHERVVSESEFEATPSERRFLRFAVGPGQPTRMSVGWMRYLALRATLHDRRFAAYIESLTGLALGPVSSLSAHAMSAGDMLAPHSDVNLDRQLAFILYLMQDWDGAFGGSLVITGLDGRITRVAPAFNTLVLFEVTSHKSHRVEAVTEAAGTARRLSLSGWFDHPPRA